jgi:hypothetical protein
MKTQSINYYVQKFSLRCGRDPFEEKKCAIQSLNVGMSLKANKGCGERVELGDVYRIWTGSKSARYVFVDPEHLKHHLSVQKR